MKRKANYEEKQNRKNGSEKGKKNPNETNNRIGKNIIIGLAVLCIIAIISAALWALSGENDKPSNTLIFTVGTEEVYLDEVNFCILQNVLSLGITAEDMQNTTAADGTNADAYYKQQILDLIMDYKVEYMVAKEKGITLTEEEKESVRADVVTWLGKVDARLLNQWGIERDLIEEVYMQRRLVYKLEQSETEEIEVEDQNYCTIYFMLFPKVEMAEDGNYATEADGETPIMLSEDAIAKRKEDAENALKELQSGADVEAIAEKYNVASYSAEESNMAESFGEPFSQYTTTLKEGEYSPVLETESTYAIIKMVKENNEEFSKQILDHYKEDLKKELLTEKRMQWYEQMKVGKNPVFKGMKWEKISLYDYVQ